MPITFGHQSNPGAVGGRSVYGQQNGSGQQAQSAPQVTVQGPQPSQPQGIVNPQMPMPQQPMVDLNRVVTGQHANAYSQQATLSSPPVNIHTMRNQGVGNVPQQQMQMPYPQQMQQQPQQVQGYTLPTPIPVQTVGNRQQRLSPAGVQQPFTAGGMKRRNFHPLPQSVPLNQPTTQGAPQGAVQYQQPVEGAAIPFSQTSPSENQGQGQVTQHETPVVNGQQSQEQQQATATAVQEQQSQQDQTIQGQRPAWEVMGDKVNLLMPACVGSKKNTEHPRAVFGAGYGKAAVDSKTKATVGLDNRVGVAQQPRYGIAEKNNPKANGNRVDRNVAGEAPFGQAYVNRVASPNAPAKGRTKTATTNIKKKR